jgi:hypothetical protein
MRDEAHALSLPHVPALRGWGIALSPLEHRHVPAHL